MEKRQTKWTAYSSLIKFRKNLSDYISEATHKDHKRTEIKNLYRELSEVNCRIVELEKQLSINVVGDFTKSNLYKHQNWNKSKIPTKVSQLKLITVEDELSYNH